MVKEDADELVEKYTREDLNRLALNLGVTGPEKLPNKKTVALEIVKARKTREYIRKPVGLYLGED